MPLDSATAQQKSFVFAELQHEYQTAPGGLPYNWQEQKFNFQAPPQKWFNDNGIPAFDKILSVKVQQMPGGYFEVFVYSTVESYVSTSVGTISLK